MSATTSLPALPSGLKELIVSGNRLTSLPVFCAVRNYEEELMVSGNQPASLLPSGLLSLSVCRNQLTRLPESLIHLSSETTGVNLEGNPLSTNALAGALRGDTSARLFGSRIRFDMAGSLRPGSPGTARRPLTGWYLPGGNRLLHERANMFRTGR